MKKLKVLNLYAGIGGNRKLWEDVEVTAVELDPEIAKIYQSYFPDDTVIVGDAHQYLLDHFKEFDFIWASPPCPTHSRLKLLCVNIGQNKLEYPDMKLYQEIIILDKFFKGKFCVENVIGYYEPLIAPQKGGRHYFWANFKIPFYKTEHPSLKTDNSSTIQKWKDHTGFIKIDLSGYKKQHKEQLFKNCVNSDLSLHILNCARNIITKSNIQQLNAFDI